jgi:CMP/dCMP kinase
MVKGFVIAIDGPVAAGKGTLAPILAKRLHGFHIDTGVFYRCLALYCLEKNIPFEHEAIKAILPKVDIQLSNHGVLLNGVAVGSKIRSVEVSNGSSKVAQYDEVLEEMIQRQKRVAEGVINEGMIVIAEGRNTGTAVFPTAALKIFLTASLSARAQRRLAQWQAKGITNIRLEEVIKDLEERDTRDMSRKKFPLITNPAEHGYLIVDNSHMTEEETIDIILQEAKRRNLLHD